MHFEELIKLQALKLKAMHQVGTDHLGEGGIQEALFAEASDSGKLRNICAAITPELFDQVEGCCSMLEISKRRFVEAALVEAVAKASAIVADVDPFAEVQ